MKIRRVLSAMAALPCAVALAVIVLALQAISGIDFDGADFSGDPDA